MARRIYIKDGGLNTSSTIPPGYTAIGSDSGELKLKTGDQISSVGGGSYSTFFLGKITSPSEQPITLGQNTETIVGDYLIPANRLNGIGFPNWSATLDFSTDQWEDMLAMFKVYITEEQGNIEGLTPLYQETFDPAMYAQREQALCTGYGASGFPTELNGIEYIGDKIRVLYFDNNSYRYYVTEFDNFDVTKDLYLTVTLEFTDDPANPDLTVGVKTLQIAIFPFK
jgi:hypothetical protein